MTAPRSELWVAGWGETEDRGSSDILMDVAVFAISDSDCSTHGSFPAAEELCAFGERQPDGTFDDSCRGDSGGPLVADSPEGTILVGLVSYGPYPAASRTPACTSRSA